MLLHSPALAIKVVPKFGLGNRLMAIVSAIRLRELGYFTSVKIQWDAQPDLDAQMSDVLDMPDCELVHPTKDDVRVPMVSNNRIPIIDNVTVPAFDTFTIENDTTDRDTMAKQLTAAAQMIRFKSDYYNMADTWNVTGRIGLHCRRSDYPVDSHLGNDQNKRQRYHRMIDLAFGNALQAENFGSYFLASDSARTDDYMQARLSNLICVPKSHHPKWSQRSKASVAEAVIDFILLSRCQRIIADSRSTFSTTAAWVGGIDRLIWIRPSI